MVPSVTESKTVIDSDIYHIQKVEMEHIVELLYINRYTNLFRATTACLQLTKDSSDLYLPMFRHFYFSLQNLVFWVFKESDSDSTVMDQAIERKESKSDKNFILSPSIKPLASPENGLALLDNFEETITQSMKSTADSKIKNCSSMSPWLRRPINRTKSDNGYPPGCVDLEVAKFVSKFIKEGLPTNQSIMRRQNILCEMRIIDYLIHFLNILFKLSRSIYLRLRQDKTELDNYSGIIKDCRKQIHNLFRAVVYKNEKIALRFISIKGSFLSLVSQKISGWNPPIDTILLLICKESHNVKEIKSDDEESLILKGAISPNDIRQIVEQVIILQFFIIT